MGSTNKITPSEMWGLFVQYRDHIKSNPIMVAEQKKGMTIIPKGHKGKLPSQILDVPRERPLTMDGFENFVAEVAKGKLGKTLEHYFFNTNKAYESHAEVCKRIRRVIRQDQIEGGMAMIYNPSITQRLNGLVEKTENKHEVSEIIIKHES